jgi:NADH:ubiquinone oxidoreductase subunit 4 (subunit M)
MVQFRGMTKLFVIFCTPGYATRASSRVMCDVTLATLVSAGVYLSLQLSSVIEYTPTTSVAITWVGALTALDAATTGLLQNDLKRVIAYITMPQMGYLFIACGLLQYDVTPFYLVTHTSNYKRMHACKTTYGTRVDARDRV